MMNDSSSTTRATVIRSLRRRLWRALENENETEAIQVYTATRADYQSWIIQEQQEAEQLERQRLGQSKKNKLSLKVKRRTSQTQQQKLQENPIVYTYDDDAPILVKEMDPSNVFVADDFLSPNDPYPSDSTTGGSSTTTQTVSARRNTKNKGPRFAGFWMRANRQDSSEDNENDDDDVEDDDTLFTTPLHEAARMGSAKLVRLFLEHGGLPNLKNGQQRTALIMAAGGLTEQEATLLSSARAAERQRTTRLEDVGIRVPIIESNNDSEDDKDHPAAVGAKKAALAVRRLFALGGNQSAQDGTNEQESPVVVTPPPFDEKRFQKLQAQRMDTVLAILSWCHPDDGSTSANEGPSINSVDERGRTGLHYAAELGRLDICMAVVSSFGAILTIVDEFSRTPCELAGEQSHAKLAAQLEARALLYADPYGIDDELMASVLSEHRDDSKLAVPFSWFETWSTVQVRQERLARTEKALMGVQKILAERQEQTKANQIMFHYDANDSLDSVLDDADIAIGVVDDEESEEEEGRSSDKEEESIHMLAQIDDDHPPSPPSERSDEMISQDTSTDAKLSIANEVMVQEDTLAAKLPGAQEATMKDETSDVVEPSSTVDSECQRLLKSLQESHIERFLTYHNWEFGKAMTEFEKDPVKALEDASVSVEMKEASLKWETLTPQTCLICFETFSPDANEWTQFRGCNHGFCVQCVGDYIVDCAQSRSGGITVICPHHECGVPLSQSELQRMAPSPSVYESLLEAADENFVASSSDLKFCPRPGCEGVVHRLVPPIVARERFSHDIIGGAVCVSFPEGDDDAPLTYEGVRDRRYVMTRGSTQPHRAHRFCFACGDDTVHWPVTCETLEQWKKKIRDEIGEVKDGDGEEDDEVNFEDVAQRLWMKANTRPCPQCKAPIEKNEGCNHMTCTNRQCRHEFCWICRKDWKLHNSETGGFFRCNRWEGEENHVFYDGEEHQPPPPHPESSDDAGATGNDGNENGYGSAVHASRVAFKKATEMKRFLHHFSRWSAHKESAALEQNMANTVCSRLAPVVEAAVEFNGSADFDFGGKGLSFVHAAFTELLECRSFLQHSYAFAFFRYPTLYYIRRNRVVKLRQREKATFEQFQSELEMMTEQMSDIVARTHLRATQTQIMFLTSEAAEKRRDFSSFLITVLDDERREKAAKERQDRASDDRNQATHPTVPPPLDISGIIERLQSRVPLTNEHNDMDSDDGAGVRYPRASRLEQRLREEEDLEEDTAMQAALRASLVTFNAESGTSLSATTSGDVEDDGDESGVSTRTTEWACEACTFVNSRGTSCLMCGTARNDLSDSASDSDDGSGEEE